MTESQMDHLFQELLEFRRTVFRICMGFTRNTLDAEDLTQEVYLIAYTKLETLRNPELMKFWLFAITRNLCCSRMRKANPGQMFPLDSDSPAVDKSPEENLMWNEQIDLLKRTIAGLPRRLREVFVMREYGLLSYEEMATVLNIPLGTVMSRLNRSRLIVTQKMRRAADG